MEELLGTKGASSKPNSFPLALRGQSPLYVTAHVGKHPTGETCSGHPEEFFWFGGAQTRPAMAPKVAFGQKDDRRIGVVMSLKDSDLFLAGWEQDKTKKSKSESTFKNFALLLILFLSCFHPAYILFVFFWLLLSCCVEG